MNLPVFTIDLDGEVSIREIAALHSKLMSARNSDDPVALDGEHVMSVDTPGLQLLASFVSERASCGRATSWTSASDVLVKGARMLDLEELLALKTDLPSPETH